MSKLNALAGAAFAACLSASSAFAADAIPYPNSGSYNPLTYSFTAAATGDVIAYIVGGFFAGYENELGLEVNGVQQGGFALNNHTSSSGDSYNFGGVTAGDTLVFIMRNISLGADVYSNASLNAAYDNLTSPYGGPNNHIYSTAYNADPSISGVPVGTYVAFEDIPFGDGSDYNYDDESFVFTNVAATVTGVPEPATWAFMLTGFALTGVAIRSRRFKLSYAKA